ncbi:asparagine synthase (glutamine-hydrolyzing) [Mucilaginibacter sp. 21P]|uniref:asparagine synthase (glutamine-hydrolyzing) n=1 Tax=Mucilaginibacter sp. 21P TaxID=2778902 RepID=UPI001C582455|nr:asparagine synthase (glutamine-hydrolyzing) [Mucilaginibacter sp. 21P]QXV63870.1 asparagine synthase (glutamine-hydrolyzing) [Mucilaginibacter sp. 21P]
MCGITGIYKFNPDAKADVNILETMAEGIAHRGPDDAAYVVLDNLGLGFKRLSIIDLAHGQQPFYNRDESVVTICNGEIYNYKELRKELIDKGYHFKTHCDVEVIVHMYDEYGIDFINRLNGQFAFCIFDKAKKELFLARDQFGICPVFYTIADNSLIFGSEIKAIIRHPCVKREVNLTALDQLFSFPGIVSPTTFFKNIISIKPGHFLRVKDGNLSDHQYWDLNYPIDSAVCHCKPESYYIDQIEDLLINSVKYRLNADVPVGFYLSGGLDSSLVGAVMKKVNPDSQYKSFSIGYPRVEDSEHDERKYQRLMARNLDSIHNEIEFDWLKVADLLKDAIYHSEGALKESYNTCSLALSKAVRNSNVKVILSGEGSDEFFGGYVGYKFDVQRRMQNTDKTLEEMLEDQQRKKLWGDPNFFYEINHVEFKDTTRALYSDKLNKVYNDFECLGRLEIDKSKLNGRHPFHKRSYLDLKLRLSDHLISDHADRVNYANSVEGRYPFLDINLIEFVKTIHPEIKLKGLVEKYILKEVGKRYIPSDITDRQKFSWIAPGSHQLLNNNIEWVNDMLSYDRIKRQGYFNPDTIERLKKRYSAPNFKLNLPYDSDLLMIVLTFNIFLEVFDMPDFA